MSRENVFAVLSFIACGVGLFALLAQIVITLPWLPFVLFAGFVWVWSLERV